MLTVHINAAAALPVVLVMILSFCAGFGLYAAGKLASGLGQLTVGFVAALAGDRSYGQQSSTGRNKFAVFGRAVVYVGLCVAAIVLSATGHVPLAYLCAVIGSFCLPIAMIRLVF